VAGHCWETCEGLEPPADLSSTCDSSTCDSSTCDSSTCDSKPGASAEKDSSGTPVVSNEVWVDQGEPVYHHEQNACDSQKLSSCQQWLMLCGCLKPQCRFTKPVRSTKSCNMGKAQEARGGRHEGSTSCIELHSGLYTPDSRGRKRV